MTVNLYITSNWVLRYRIWQFSSWLYCQCSQFIFVTYVKCYYSSSKYNWYILLRFLFHVISDHSYTDKLKSTAWTKASNIGLGQLSLEHSFKKGAYLIPTS